MDAGIYGQASRQRVYEALFDRAGKILAEGRSVVLDGTFSSLATFRRGYELSRQLASERFLAIECMCRPEVAHERIRRRLAGGRDASEARPEIHDFQRERWDPWPPSIPQVQIDTEQPLSQQLKLALAALAPETAR